MNTVSKNIKRLRTQNNMTQEDLAEKMHVTRQTVSNWEIEKNQPDIDTLQTLANVFNTDINDLIYGTQKGKYPKYQKKYIKDLIISLSIIVAFIILRLTLLPYLLVLKGRTYKYGLELGLLSFLTMAIIFFFIGFCILSVFSLWFDCSLRKSKQYGIFAIICALPSVVMICEFLSFKLISNQTPMYLILAAGIYPWLNTILTQLMPAIAGVLAFLHRNRIRN